MLNSNQELQDLSKKFPEKNFYIGIYSSDNVEIYSSNNGEIYSQIGEILRGKLVNGIVIEEPGGRVEIIPGDSGTITYYHGGVLQNTK